MKSGLNLVDLAAKITETAKSARDFIIPAPALKMVGTSLGLHATFGAKASAGQEVAEGVMLGVNDVAHDQLSEYAEVPRAYYRRCRDNGATQLLADNLNHWMGTKPNEKRLIRTAGSSVRAFLSDRYRPLDNYDLAQAVLPIIHDMGLRVESADLTEKRLYIKAVNEKLEAEIDPGNHTPAGRDIVQAGVIIQNSEVGHGALSVAPLIFRLICKNGMVVADQAVRKYHSGDRRKTETDLENALEVYSDATRKKMDGALWAQIGDLTRAAVSDALFQQIVDKMRGARTGEQIKSPAVAVEVARKRFDLSEGEGHGLLAHLAAGGDLSRWGLLNAVTRMAQDVPSYDRSTELERLGGQVLEMNAKDWNAIAAAV